MQGSIAPKEEIHIETISNKSLKVIDHEANLFARERKLKVPIALKLNVKIRSQASKARLQHPTH
jgi:hypothetical protein